VKLLVSERESGPLRRFLRGKTTISSQLLVTELGRYGQAENLPDADLDAVLDDTALEISDDIDGVVSYDNRLTDAARASGLTVERPGAG
jgi:hypothetical protein